MIVVENVRAGYGRIEVLRGVNLDVATSQIACVIGANGAGKTTLLMTICGRVPAKAGSILFDGEDITRVRTFELVKRGIAHVPEGRRIFPRMTVLENLQMGAFAAPPAHFASDLDFVLALFPALKDRRRQFGGTLSGGEQQMLAIARALMSRPRLLLLDEPSLGLAPLLVRQVFEMIRAINRERNTTILLIEQNAFQALLLATKAYVMVNGTIAKQGTGAELLRDPAVRAAYLEGNANGIALIQQDRGTGARGAHIVDNVHVHDNTVTMDMGQTGAVQDVSSNEIFTSRNNRFTNNTYHISSLDRRWFAWMNTSGRTIGEWKAYGNDVDGTFLSP